MQISQLKSLIIQFIKFGFVGVLNTIVSLTVYYICLSLGVHYLLANTISFIASVLNAYFFNRKFVFKSCAKTSTSLIKTYAAYTLTYLTGMVLLYIFVEIVMISELIAPIIIIIINVPINFCLIKFWAMK